MSEITAVKWEDILQKYPNGHVLQSEAWGQVKSAFGWYARYVANEQAKAQILFRKLPLGLRIAYIPKGPMGSDWISLWPLVDQICRRERAIFLKVEPDCWEEDFPAIAAQFPGFRPNMATIQPRRTIVINLASEPQAWLDGMKQKHRYNTRLAAKKEVVISQSADVQAFHNLMLTTGERETFGVHSLAYYQAVYDQFVAKGQGVLLLASFQGQALAGIIVLRQGQRAWYFYGASSNLERQRMPAYLLQFEAMKWAKAAGCLEYDLWGIPDEDEAVLEAQFEHRQDGLWGVYRFKRGFGGQVKRTAAALEKIYQPALYWMFSFYMARRGGLRG